MCEGCTALHMAGRGGHDLAVAHLYQLPDPGRFGCRKRVRGAQTARCGRSDGAWLSCKHGSRAELLIPCCLLPVAARRAGCPTCTPRAGLHVRACYDCRPMRGHRTATMPVLGPNLHPQLSIVCLGLSPTQELLSALATAWHRPASGPNLYPEPLTLCFGLSSAQELSSTLGLVKLNERLNNKDCQEWFDGIFPKVRAQPGAEGALPAARAAFA